MRTYCLLLYAMCDLKAAQIDMKRCLLRELILYAFKLGHKTAEEDKNISCVKAEGSVDLTKVSRLLEKFYKNLDD